MRWFITTAAGSAGLIDSVAIPLEPDARRATMERLADELRSSLGTAWRVGPPSFRQNGATLGAEITLDGPRRDDDRAMLAQATAAILAGAGRMGERQGSGALAAGANLAAPGRPAPRPASDSADALDSAISALRSEIAVIPALHSRAEDVVVALARTLPWASFAADSRTNSIVASGTGAELDAARVVVKALDDLARARSVEASVERARRMEASPRERFASLPVTIEFPGGTLREYLALLANVSGFESWIVEDPRSEQLVLPPIRLLSIAAESSLRALDGLPVIQLDGDRPATTVLEVTKVDPHVQGDELMPIYRLRADVRSDGATPPSSASRAASPETRTEVFVLSASDATPEALERENAPLLAAIEVGTALDGGGQTLRMRLHPPSRMLFVSGSSSELALVRAIIASWSSLRQPR
ncbi:MAG TPA: hypothetical protein PKC43_03700 [Phycisphaerales bacterium]|nr:hypothetical protein [Phycisphaerales bacterium]HMP36531.1 hypothetical protein [Phycisphaerales bacterium]